MKRTLGYLGYALVGLIVMVTIAVMVLIARIFIDESQIPDHYSIVGKWVPVKEESYIRFYMNKKLQRTDTLCMLDSLIFDNHGKAHGFLPYPAARTHIIYDFELKGDTLWLGNYDFLVDRLDEELELRMILVDPIAEDTLTTFHYQHFRRM